MAPKQGLPRGCGVAFGIVATLFVVFGAGCGLLISSLNNLDFGPTPRKHLAPIPVSPTVCPYVRVMHKAANDFQRVNPLAYFLSSGETPKARWRRQRARIAQTLTALEFSVAASRPRFPPPIRRRFDVVLASIRRGQPLLARSTDGADLLVRAGDTFSTGQTAFGEASDLVGDACGVHLAANPPWDLVRPRGAT